MAIFGGCARVVTDGAGGSTGDFLDTGRTLSNFVAIQVDPRSEDSAGPQFSAAGDLNGDGLVDVVSAWNQSQPLQIHLQRRSASGAISFETVNIAGNIPVVTVAGLAIADFNRDDRPDIAVLVKHSLLSGAGCLAGDPPEDGLAGAIVLYLGPSDGSLANESLAWEEVMIGTSFLSGAGSAGGAPEEGGYTSMAVGDMDLNGTMDIVVAWNSSCGGATADVVVFSNQGPTQVRDGTWTAFSIPDGFVKGTTIKDVPLGDIARDCDLDIVATSPNS
ncbi:MAG: VCBS repeat-containing protein, partial [Planctomycetes bacterium]|nr:VCBS repeat-containing protein [Planctomycetota bacterium]